MICTRRLFCPTEFLSFPDYRAASRPIIEFPSEDHETLFCCKEAQNITRCSRNCGPISAPSLCRMDHRKSLRRLHPIERLRDGPCRLKNQEVAICVQKAWHCPPRKRPRTRASCKCCCAIDAMEGGSSSCFTRSSLQSRPSRSGKPARHGNFSTQRS